MGRTRSTTDALGNRTVYELDTLDRMTAANDPANQTIASGGLGGGVGWAGDKCIPNSDQLKDSLWGWGPVPLGLLLKHLAMRNRNGLD